jgi:flagellar secretion chaperone FliS
MTTIDDDRTELLCQRYLETQVETATPVQRLLMLQNRLLLDLHAADAGFGAQSIERVHANLVHAQQIVLVLRDSLKGSDWTGAEPLRAVYWFVYQRLIDCNMSKDHTLLPACTALVEQIVEANTRAATDAGQPVDGAVQVA